MNGKQGCHRWFIEPLNALTNEILAKNQEFLSEEQVFDGVKCEDGKFHKLWGCRDYRFVSDFLKNRRFFGSVFKIWHQEGNGQIRVWVFPRKKKVQVPVAKSVASVDHSPKWANDLKVGVKK